MTKERVESIRKIVLPFIAKKLKEIDYEGLGESDAKEFTNDFNEILKLAEDAQPKTGYWIYDKNIENWRCSECGETPKTLGYCGTADFMAEHFKYCNHCGTRMAERIDAEYKKAESEEVLLSQETVTDQADEKIDIGDEVIGDFGRKGVVVGIVINMGEIMLSLLMREHKVPQLVKASRYKTKTGRHFPQIAEVLKQMQSEWQQDHEILKAYSDGVNDVLDEIKADIEQEYKVESEHPYGQGLSRALEIIDRYKAESEVSE